jgi:hypothetical protein
VVAKGCQLISLAVNIVRTLLLAIQINERPCSLTTWRRNITWEWRSLAGRRALSLVNLLSQLALMYWPNVSYDSLVAGATFTVREGPHIIGFGTVQTAPTNGAT